MSIGDANCNRFHQRTSNFKDPLKSGFDFTVIADSFPGADLDFSPIGWVPSYCIFNYHINLFSLVSP